VTTEHNPNSFTTLASWLSQCLSEKQLPQQIDTPEQLVDDEALGWVGTGLEWAHITARSASHGLRWHEHLLYHKVFMLMA